jgi:hypothetical protein
MLSHPMTARPRSRALLAVAAGAAAVTLTLAVFDAVGMAGPAAATPVLHTSRMPSQPASAVGIVSGRHGYEIILTTASGRLDRLTLTPTTAVAELIDADPDGAVAGTRLTAEGRSVGGLLDADDATLAPAGAALPALSAPTGVLTVETGTVLNDTGGLVTLQTPTGQAAVWLGLGNLTTVVPGTAADVHPGIPVVAYGRLGLDGTLTAGALDVLLTS